MSTRPHTERLAEYFTPVVRREGSGWALRIIDAKTGRKHADSGYLFSTRNDALDHAERHFSTIVGEI